MLPPRLIARKPHDKTSVTVALTLGSQWLTLAHTGSQWLTLLSERKLLFFTVLEVAHKKEPKLVNCVTFAVLKKLSPGSIRLRSPTSHPNCSSEEFAVHFPNVKSASRKNSFFKRTKHHDS